MAKAVQNRLAHNGCRTIHFEPGSPWESPYIESFRGTFRKECLDWYAFASGQEAQEIVAAWRQEYSLLRPRSSLGYLTPAEFSHRCGMEPDQATSSLVVQVGGSHCRSYIE